jgi:hypothetical protein
VDTSTESGAQQRYSFASSVIIRNKCGEYLLGVNKNALQKRDEVRLTPVGGKIAVKPAQRREFEALGAVFDTDVPAGAESFMTDLVFRGPIARQEDFRRLFGALCSTDDKTAKREMLEELTQETRTLRPWHLRSTLGRRLQFSHVGTETANSDRAGGERTVRLMSFFDVTLPWYAQRRLERRAVRRPFWERIVERRNRRYAGVMVCFASREEIDNGHTGDGDHVDGALIPSICRTMLR